MEAKYVAASETAKSIVWVNQLLKDVSVICEKMMSMLFIDNLSTIKLIGNPEFHKRSMHIKTRYHLVHQMLTKKINVSYIPTKDQVTDVFTMGQPSEKLTMMKKCRGSGHPTMSLAVCHVKLR